MRRSPAQSIRSSLRNGCWASALDALVMAEFLWLSLTLLALAGPSMALRGWRLGRAAVVALLPAAMMAAAFAASFATAWGHRRAAGSDDFTNSGDLFVFTALLLVAGVAGFVLPCALVVAQRLRLRRRLRKQCNARGEVR